MGWEREALLRPKSDELLRAAHVHLGGQMWTKVRVDPGEATYWERQQALYVDAVWLPAPEPGFRSWTDDPEQFDASLGESTEPAVVVARGYADRTVFGLLLAAQDLLGLRYPRLSAPIGAAAVVEPGGHDANMDWVYHRHGVGLVEVGGAS